MLYKLEITPKAQRDLDKITQYTEMYSLNTDKIIEKINKDIENLKFMPRIHKTLISYQNKKGEYRRIVSGKYIIIYQISKENISILRVFSEKQNYLSQEKFILKEEPQKYYYSN